MSLFSREQFSTTFAGSEVARKGAVLDALPAAVYFTDERGVILAFNRRAAVLWGREPRTGDTEERFCGAFRLYQPDGVFMPHAHCPMADAIRTGAPQRNRHVVVERPDGTRRSALVNIEPLRGPDGGLIGAVNVLVDVTDAEDVAAQWRADADLRSMEVSIQRLQSAEALGALASGVTRDMGDVLADVSSCAERARVSNGGVECGHWRDALAAVARGQAVVDRLARFAQRPDVERRLTDLLVTVTEAGRLLRASLPPEIELRMHGAPRLPRVLADAISVNQILLSLARNAAQAMSRGGVLDVSVASFVCDAAMGEAHPELRHDPFVELRVQDSGAGMAPEVLSRVFEPFFTTNGSEGGGLGLAMVRRILEEHGGHVFLESEPGRGTTVRCFFPAMHEVAPESFILGHAPRPGRGERILFVDDEHLLIELTTEALSSLGYAVTSVSHPTQALHAFESDAKGFDLVITDYSMPRMNGLDFARALRAMAPEVPILLMTGWAEMLKSEDVQAAGVDRVLMKPLTHAQLGVAIRDALDLERP